MKIKKFFVVGITFSACAIGFGGFPYMGRFCNPETDEIVMANIEALTQTNDTEKEHLFKEKKKDTTTILDDETGNYKRVVVITCLGKGGMVCQ